MFHFRQADAKHIAALLNDSSLQQFAVTLVQREAGTIDSTFTFRQPQQQDLLLDMIDMINRYSGEVQLSVFLKEAGILGIKLVRNNQPVTRKPQNTAPTTYSYLQSHTAHHNQPQFGMIE